MRREREPERGARLHCKLFAKMGDDRPFVCHAPGCGQRFTNEDHLAVHKHKHEMTLKFAPRTDSVIIADQTPTPTRFLKNCEEVGLFNDLANSFEQDDDDNKRAKNSLPAASSVALDMSLQTPSDVKVKEETPVEVDSSPPDSPDSISATPESRRELLVKDMPPRSSAPTPTIVRPGSLPLHLGFDAFQPTMPSPTSVITQAPPSNRTLGSPTSHYSMMMLPSGQAVPVLPGPVQMPSVINLARPMCMVPNIPGIPGPPLGSSSSGSNSPSGYSIHCEAKMVPKSTVASIILKWKTFGTNRTLPRAGRPAKQSNRGRRALVGEIKKNPKITVAELQRCSQEMGESSRKSTITAALHQSGLYGRVARRKHLLSARHMKASMELAKKTSEGLPRCCRDRRTGCNRRKDECGQVQRYPGQKPSPECSEPQTGLKIHLPRRQ
ncbi:cyclic AMP-dependent transcription factor ATF-7a isoform X6 [Phyllopteryx taeniolatus]|uniref:cyclic AMP-dependent transcription factor ATF-7a isoform X6 n=1 Tax=Phyllopteryx taeniolatus TaxID=161469 RepID=UPI002AD24B66|nr:cyclic AMP-dependent transcription factor ATF-7a isoform X6 [Phyllopteryx taeniolatus]